MRYLLILALIFSLHENAEASCSSFLNKLVSLIRMETYKAPEMSNEVVSGFQMLRDKNFSETISVSFRDIFYKESKYLLSTLPIEVRDYLSDYPSGRENAIAFKKVVSDKFGFEYDSIMSNIWSIIQSIQKRNPESLKEAIEQAVMEFENLPASEKNRIEKSFLHQQIFVEANGQWNQFGKIKVPMVENGNNVQVEINGQNYLGKKTTRRGKQVVILTVPVELVRHPAWNPLNHDYIAKLASDPFRLQKMEYDVVLGHNGYFYLMDGNHRFTLYTNPTVKVILSAEVSTQPLRVFFDLLNITQPTADQIMSIHRGELNPYELIPSHIRQNLVFEN